jgi:hypothetical protein
MELGVVPRTRHRNLMVEEEIKIDFMVKDWVRIEKRALGGT